MAKLGKDKIALFLACASVLGGKTQAMNISKVQNPQTIGTVGGARNQSKKINWGKIAKIGGFTVAGLVALETIHSLIGGLTDSKLGSYSIGRAIKNYVNKNGQPEPAKPDGNVDVPKSVEIVENNDINNNRENNDFEKEHEAFMKKIDNLVVDAEVLVKNFQNTAENSEKFINESQFFLGANHMMLNKELVDFNSAISKKLGKEHSDELQTALEKIKEENSGLTENQKEILKDLLQVIKSDKINKEDAETIGVSGSGATVKISVTLNSIVYCLELLGPAVNICKSGKVIAYLRY